MSKIKDLLGIARPGGIDDIVVRAVKTGLAVFISTLGFTTFSAIDFGALEAAALAGGAAAVSVLMNAVLSWTQK